MNITLTYSASRTLRAGWLVLLLVSLGGMSACQTTGDEQVSDTPSQPVVAPAQQAAVTLQTQGDYRGAADAWLVLANKTADTASAERDQYLLQAARALLQLEDTAAAEQALNRVKQQQTPAWQIVKANLLVLQNQPAESLVILDKLPFDNLDRTMQQQTLLLQAQVYKRLGNHLESARQRVKLDEILDDVISQDDNHTELWSSLNSLPGSTLSSSYADTPPGHFRDWLELAILNQQARQVGGTLQLETWQKRHPLHPAVPRFLARMRNIENSTRPLPTHIALLLPLSGRIAEPARAVRDGFLAAYYRDSASPLQTSIRLYDANATNIAQVYQQAIREGAKFVVGPLTKDAVDQLAQETSLAVPTLVLNANEDEALPHSQLYQFALLPEDEARQAAERVWLDGGTRGIILYPESDWGQRVAGAFQKHWEHLGGRLVDIQPYSLTSRDYATSVRSALKVDESKKRFQQLKNLLGRKIEFEVRRRQDVDFIFLASFPEQARQIRPQLKFYGASDVPVYATSHIFTGKVDPQRDQDMNGIIFGDMPWTINNQAEDVRDQLAALWQRRTEKLVRFYAFGMDAYNVIPHLQRLQQYSFERFTGYTGSLRMDDNLRLVRQLSWAMFSAGKPRAVADRTEADRGTPP